MSHGSRCVSLLLTLLAALLGARSAAAQGLPEGFVLEPIGSQWESPVGLCFIDAQRLLVAERDGRVWYVVDDVKKNQVYDIAGETLINGDRGLLGIAVPPDFDASGWLYLLFIVDRVGGDSASLAFARLIRVHTSLDGNGNLVADPASRQYLLGDTWTTGITSCHLSHTIGSLRFLSDGSLVLTSGDNAHYDATDAGGLDPQCFTAGRAPPDQDLGAFRSQYDNTLCGKVLRLDPETGLGLADNPYYTGNPDDLLSRVYARGLRNPFRFTLLPDSGPREALLIADVGWNTWEEINLCTGGENFGRPCFEGTLPQNDYQAADFRDMCAGVGTSHSAPLLAWHHSQSGSVGFRGNCATGLAVYTGLRYPARYRGRLFFFDYGRNFLRAAELGTDLTIDSTLGFGRDMGGPVDLVSEPGTGDLVYASIASGVFRLLYLGSQLPPDARASATPAFGAGDLTVELSAAGSSDPENQDLTYLWDFGDGSDTSDLATVVHFYAGQVSSLARLTVTDSEGLSDSAELVISPNNTPPRILTLDAPLDGGTYTPDEPLRLWASAADDEDGMPQATWTLDLVHDHHEHPDWATSSGLHSELIPDSHGPGDNHFIVHLRVRDSRGLTDERTLEIFDPHSVPQAHLVALDETRVHAGQTIAPVGHVDYSYGRVGVKQARLTWDWGDGTADVVAEARHQIDSTPRHAYRLPGRYKLRLVAELEGRLDVENALIEVGQPRPAVAIFAPLEEERWVPRAQQEELVATLQASLATRASEVRAFALGQGANLAAWMESLVDDPVSDVLVLLDFLPTETLPDGLSGSLLERWIAGGNGLVWSGQTPFLDALDDEGRVTHLVLGADQFFQAVTPFIVQGSGRQVPTALGTSVLPSLIPYRAIRALRPVKLGPDWRVARVFAEDGNQESDDIELEHAARRGFYAQLVCSDDTSLPRVAVLNEYLLARIQKSRVGSVGAPARR